MSYTYVYIIANENGRDGTSPIKVGISRCPEDRLGQIQTGCWKPLTLYMSYCFTTRKQAMKLEHDFHKTFGKFGLSGEWFELDPPAADEAIMGYIEKGSFPTKLVEEIHIMCGAE